MQIRSTRNFVNLRQGRNDWYSIRNSAAGPTEIMIYDEIGYFGVTAQDFIRDLGDVKGDVTVHLNTPGGEVFDGIAIYNALNQRSGKVRIVIDGLAASIGSVIAMAASPGDLAIAKRAEMMIHDGFSMAVGNAADMRKLADDLDKQSDNIAAIYSDRTGKDQAYWRDLMKQETWYIGQEAVDAGLVDRVLDRDAVQNSWDLSIFASKNEPRINLAVDPDRSHRYIDLSKLSHDEVHYRDGTEQHDCGNCSMSSVTGGTMHCSLVVDPIRANGVCDRYEAKSTDNKLENASVDESPWDASKAWHNGTTADDPEAFYRGICAGEKTTGEPTAQAHWALPYKYTPSSPPNRAGVRAALGRLDQTHDLKNPDGVRAKLQKIMKQINPDYEPSDAIDPGLLRAALLSGLEESKK